MTYELTTLDKVKEVAGIQAGEISDSELTNYILDTSSRIYNKYGRPLASYSVTGSPTGSYLIAGAEERISVLNSIELDSTELSLGSDYTYITNDGQVTLGSDLTAGSLAIEYTPEMYYLLASFMSAEAALEAMYVFTGEQVNNTRLIYIQEQIQKILNEYISSGIPIISTTSGLMTSDIATEYIRENL